MASSSSSSASIILQAKYDVFLSFRGEDTRDNFTSHLYAALCRRQIQTFIDDEGLKSGEEISAELLRAIEESKISVIIFSKDYASSRWCLDELVKILECKEKNGQIVMPVFYRASPTDVRKQTGSFKAAFTELEKKFKKMPEKLQRWRAALTTAANLSGWDSMRIKPESKLVGKIVNEIWKILNDISPSSDHDGLVGIEPHIKRIISLLEIGSSDFRIVGIWGMGGIGKTTIAGALFNQISNQFESSCFIPNIRQESEKRGLVHLRNEFLSHILERNHSVGTPNMPLYIKEKLQRKNVLIVFDDVDDVKQVEFLTGRINRFGQGSRVIITSRDKQVLRSYGVNGIYEIKGLNSCEALQLFSKFAFKQRYPPEDFMELAQEVFNYPQGNPLALKVLGSSLYQKTKEDWESVLNKLRKISNIEIYKMLKISYDGLDREYQNIFLDIACFFKGYDRNHAKKILNSIYLSTQFGFSTLLDKSLMTISDNNKLEMHDLLQEMGWETVRREAFREPGKRSRLWDHEDILHVLEKHTGTDEVQGLFLDMSKITDLHLSSRAFENMRELKYLKLYVRDWQIRDYTNTNKVQLPHGLKYLSNELRYLCWYGYPLKSLPSNFSPKRLVELDLPYSNVDEQLRLERKNGSNVKLIGLGHAYAPEPEQGKRLVRVPSPIQYFTNLGTLRLSCCKSLRCFQRNIHFKSPITLDLSYCINLTAFPQVSGNIKELYLTGTAIEDVPSSIAYLTGLESLHLRNCTRLKSISPYIYELKSLQHISISDYEISSTLSSSIVGWKEIKRLFFGDCNITKVPEELCCLSSLVSLNLSGNNFESLPASIKQLSQLKTLYLYNCKMLASIPELPLALEYLDATNCGQLRKLPELPSNLVEFNESDLEMISKSFHRSFWSMRFTLTNCPTLNHKGDNEILTDSQERIQHTATTALRLRYEKVILDSVFILLSLSHALSSDTMNFTLQGFEEIPHCSICLPGTKIPDWFSHQSSGPSITIEIPNDCYDKGFIGFALSAIITSGKTYYEESDSIGVICTDSFANTTAEFKWNCIVYCPVHVLIESDHLALGYSPCTNLKGDSGTASFEFIASDHMSQGPAESLKVKCCGVHPVYVQLKMNIEDLAPDATGDENLSGSENDTSNEGENEPHANKKCFSGGGFLLLFSCWTFIFDFFRQT